VQGDLTWQAELGSEFFNLYRGDLQTLRLSGVYTQTPGAPDAAAIFCRLSVPSFTDSLEPEPGGAVFYLVTGIVDGIEGSLGLRSDGSERPRTLSCF
jgi:hypothetical protein